MKKQDGIGCLSEPIQFEQSDADQHSMPHPVSYGLD